MVGHNRLLDEFLRSESGVVRVKVTRAAGSSLMNGEDEGDEEEGQDQGGSTTQQSWWNWFWCCGWLGSILRTSLTWIQGCWRRRWWGLAGRSPGLRKEDITYILQQNPESETYSESERHGSFTSGSLSIGSGTSSGGRDLKAEHYSQIQARRASSGLLLRKESGTIPVIEFKTIEFWPGGPGGGTMTPVQPKLLLSPGGGRRDRIGSQGSGDQIRPDLYPEEPSASSGASGVDGAEEGTGGQTPNFQSLGSLHFSLNFDLGRETLMVRVLEARDLPRPMTMDPSKQDQAHSNPYVKVCLLPNQKDSRTTGLRKKTQNPKFDETFTYQLPFHELQRRTLQLIIKDFDKYSRHRIIGQVLLPCDEFNVLKGLHIWRNLEPVHTMSEEDLGELLFSLCYLPAAGRLNVDVLRAKQLLPTDLVGGAAPYVRVSVVIKDRVLKTKKTSYKKYTLDPVFNESLSFDLSPGELSESALVISVLDFNGGVLKDNFIGRIVLGKEASGPHEVTHWKTMLNAQRTPVAQWHSLKSRSNCDQVSGASRLIS